MKQQQHHQAAQAAREDGETVQPTCEGIFCSPKTNISKLRKQREKTVRWAGLPEHRALFVWAVEATQQQSCHMSL